MWVGGKYALVDAVGVEFWAVGIGRYVVVDGGFGTAEGGQLVRLHAGYSGAVCGGGLTVIANAPNPAGQALLNRFFGDGISPGKLLMGALAPTIVVSLVIMMFPDPTKDKIFDEEAAVIEKVEGMPEKDMPSEEAQ